MAPSFAYFFAIPPPTPTTDFATFEASFTPVPTAFKVAATSGPAILSTSSNALSIIALTENAPFISNLMLLPKTEKSHLFFLINLSSYRPKHVTQLYALPEFLRVVPIYI